MLRKVCGGNVFKAKPVQQKICLEPNERGGMREAGRFNAQLMDHIRTIIRPGITTREIDRQVYKFTRDHGHQPATLGYKGQKGNYPASCCTSVNDVVCHGIPGDYLLREGDILNVDVTSIVDGWHGDSSETFMVGQVSDEARKLVQCTHDCLWKAIRALSPGCRVSVIGDAITDYAHAQGYGVVEEYVGHGLGRKFHQPPTVPHVATDESRRTKILPGTCFTVEPMINAGTKDTLQSRRDGWTVRTKDGKLSAQFEHTILMTETGPEVLTLTQHGPQEGEKF